MNIGILFQRIEGFCVFLLATIIYFNSGFSWIIFILLLFSFDIFMIGYLFDKKIGAFTYNIGHSMVAPALLGVIYCFTTNDIVLGLTCLWFAHIGFDRAGGYGLKLIDGFNHTHLGSIGKSNKT